MPYTAFHELFPEVAKKETRNLTVPPGSDLGLPPGNYLFIELYCDERKCDCRRVFFNVYSSARKDTEAVIAWGWEDRAFYARWFGRDDPRMIKEMQGPILNVASPQREYANILLGLTENLLLQDARYVERIKRHYAMFRERIDGRKK